MFMEGFNMPAVSKELLKKLYMDLRNERKHMMFYLTNASTVQGLDSIEVEEIFTEEAAEEMKHVKEFQDMIVGVGGTLLDNDAKGFEPFDVNLNTEYALKYALHMEEEVVENYVTRISEIEKEEDPVTRKWLEVFYEKQIEKSRSDVDRYKRLLSY